MTEFTCWFCGDPVDPAGRSTWWRIVGWEHKAAGPKRKSGSDIALREPRDEFAHDRCVRRAQAGVASGQETLV